MKQIVKQALATAALSVMAVGLIAPGPAEAKKGQKNDVIKPNPDLAATEIETGQMLDKGPRWPKPTARQANGSPDGSPTPPGATDIEQGQLLDKGPRWKPSATERRAHSGPGGTPPAAAKKGSSALLLGIGGLAAIAAIIAVASGGTPVSR